MVYSTLQIVLGVALTKEELTKIVELNEEDDTPIEDEPFDGLRHNRDVKLFHLPGHDAPEEAEPRPWLIGVSLHTYWHKVGTHCEQCQHHHCGTDSDDDKNQRPGFYTLCDGCIGATNNGVYDVAAIVDQMVAVNLRHVCLRCFADNRHDLGAPAADLPVVGNRVVGDSTRPPCSAAPLAAPNPTVASLRRPP